MRLLLEVDQSIYVEMNKNATRIPPTLSASIAARFAKFAAI